MMDEVSSSLTLEEAIKHCLEVAEREQEKGFLANIEANRPTEYGTKCYKCAEEHRQLASWLKVLKEIWDSGSCNDCKFRGHCDIEPKVGQLVRFNCYHFSREDEQKGNEMELEEAVNYLQELSDYLKKLLECPSVFEEDKEDE